jgi:hypothetical protein
VSYMTTWLGLSISNKMFKSWIPCFDIMWYQFYFMVWCPSQELLTSFLTPLTSPNILFGILTFLVLPNKNISFLSTPTPFTFLMSSPSVLQCSLTSFSRPMMFFDILPYAPTISHHHFHVLVVPTCLCSWMSLIKIFPNQNIPS